MYVRTAPRFRSLLCSEAYKRNITTRHDCCHEETFRSRISDVLMYMKKIIELFEVRLFSHLSHPRTVETVSVGTLITAYVN